MGDNGPDDGLNREQLAADLSAVFEQFLDDYEQRQGDRLGAEPKNEHPRRPISTEDIERILEFSDIGIRNHLITLGYWDMAAVLLGYTHPFAPPGGSAAGGSDHIECYDHGRTLIDEALRPPAPERPRLVLNANFCTYATWSSFTVGRNVRNRLGPRALEGSVPEALRSTVTSLAIDARRTNDNQMSKLLAMGQAVVFDEIMHAIAELIASTTVLDETGPSLAEHFPGTCSATELAAMDPSNKTINTLIAAASAEPAIRSLLEPRITTRWDKRGDGHLDPPVPDALYNALVSYYLARQVASLPGFVNDAGENDPGLSKAHAELILRANVQIGSYEQTRVQQVLDYPANQFPFDYFNEHVGIDDSERQGAGRWRRRLNEAVLSRAQAHLGDTWRRFFTSRILVLRLGDEVLRLGQDIPDAKSSGTFLPQDLETIEDDWLRQLMHRFDHSFGLGHGTAAYNWANYGDRLNYIVNLFRSRAQEPGIWVTPFTEREERLVRMQRDPYDDRRAGG